jgi:hypothetical protein
MELHVDDLVGLVHGGADVEGGAGEDRLNVFI